MRSAPTLSPLVLQMKSASVEKPPVVGTLFEFTRFLFVRSGRPASVAMALLILASLTEGASLLLLLPILKLIDSVSANVAIPMPPGFLAEQFGSQVEVGLGLIMFCFVAVITLRAILMRLKEIQSTAVTLDFINGLRNDLFASVTQSRWSFLARLRGSDINHALTADIERVQSAAVQLLMLLQIFVMLAVYGGVALVISPKMAVIAGAIGVVVIISMAPIRRIAQRYGATVTIQRQEQYRIVSEFVAGVKVAKAANAEPVYVGQLQVTLHSMRTSTMRFTRLYTASTMLFQIASAAGLAGFIFLAVSVYRIEYSSTIALIFLFIRVTPLVIAIQGLWQSVMTSLPALDAMLQLHRDAVVHREPESATQKTAALLMGQIEFCNVCYSYKLSDQPALTGLDFTIPVNEITAIVGPSGSGKSTTADLLMGLLEPDTGHIMIGDVELTASRRKRWRDSLAYVPQESFLLHDSLAANLAFGIGMVDESAMWDVLRTANADEFVRQLPDGLATVVGDRGLRLSGGERQRIALARALLRKPHLLLLDEATSSLDWESQSMIASAIEALRGRMTVVTIAHRPSMIAFADWVIAIKEGKVVESGSYAKLAETPDSYLQQILVGEG